MAARTCNFGVKTRSGHGGFPVGVGRTITGGASASDWTVDSRGDLVPAGAYGSATTFTLSSYALTLDNADTVAITMLTGSAHVKSIATGTNADTTTSFQLRTLLNGITILRGETIWCRDGVFNADNDDYRIRPPASGYSGPVGEWIKVRAENTALMLTGSGAGHEITQLTIDNTLQGSTPMPTDLWFEGHLCRPILAAATGSARAAGVFRESSNAGRQSRMFFKNMRFSGQVINDANGLANGSGINMTVDDLTVEDCIFHDLYNPTILAGDSNTIRRCAFIRASNDSMKFSGVVNPVVEDSISIDKRYPVGIGAHPDHLQAANGGSSDGLGSGAWQGWTVRRFIAINGDASGVGAEDGQGVFSDDNYIDALYTNTLVENVITMTQQIRGFSHSNTSNSVIRRCTILREETNPNQAIMTIRGGDNNRFEDCFTDSILTDEVYNPGSGGTRLTTNTALVRCSEIGSVGLSSAKAAYATAMQNPQYGVANRCCDPDTVPTWTIVNASKAALMAKFAPKLGVLATAGGMMNPDGTYRGALFPNGTWNDGTVYGAGSVFSPPPARRSFVRSFRIRRMGA